VPTNSEKKLTLVVGPSVCEWRMGLTSVFGILTPWILKILRLCLFLNQWSGAELQHTQLIMFHNF